jgi:hypothetical protein
MRNNNTVTSMLNEKCNENNYIRELPILLGEANNYVVQVEELDEKTNMKEMKDETVLTQTDGPARFVTIIRIYIVTTARGHKDPHCIEMIFF